MHINQKVVVPYVDRYTCIKGYPREFDPPQRVEGFIKERALFLELRVLVEFEVNHAPCQVWKYATEVELVGS